MMAGIAPTWEIRYSKYVGDLFLFDEMMYNKTREELVSRKRGDITLTYDRKNGELLMVEVDDAEKMIPGIEEKEKSDIINKVKECLLK